jgi:hypothetical protein
MNTNMKTVLAATLAAAASVSAHSWIECVHHENAEILEWMKGNSTLSPPVIVDPAMPWYADSCKGWPRGKANPGNWIDESTNYVWNIAANSWNGGAYHPADTSACNPSQRAPNQLDGAPMAEVSAGGMFRLRFGGNGHTRGVGPADGKPGDVSVYWKATPETEITDISEFTDNNLLARAGFADNSFSYPADPAIIKPVDGLVDKGNWMEVTVPSGTAAGRYMLVWVWSYDGANQWSTCFDINVTGGGSGNSHAVAPVRSEPSVTVAAVDAPTPDAVKAPAYVATKTTLTTEWATATQYVKNKRVHARNF